MSIIRLFFSATLSADMIDKLDKSQSHYLTKVMRIPIGGNFSLFNKFGEWQTIIKKISKNDLNFKVTKQLRHEENETDLWLAFSPIRSNFFNFMIQKATELGVTKFIPVITERTVVRNINYERLIKIVTEASEQCNRLSIPEIDKIQKLDEFFKNNKDLNLIFGDLNSDNKKLEINNKKLLCILIGPEGDFSPSERQNILSVSQAVPFTMSKNILRSDTAVISAISLVNFINNYP